MPGNPPHDLVAIVISPYEIYLSWINGENDYPYQNIQVWRKIGEGAYAKIANIPAFKTSYTSGGLTPETLHCYYLVGEWWEPPGETDPSNEACETTYALLQKPSDLEAKTFASFIELTWRDNSSAEDEFRIDRKEGEGEWVENYAAVPANVEFFRDADVTPGETYIYRLRALELPDSFSGYTDEAAATANTAPGLVQNLQISDRQDTWMRLTWGSPSEGGEVTGYRIMKSEDGWDYSEIAVVDSDVFTYLAKGLAPSTAYWFAVCAYNGVGDGICADTAVDMLIDGGLEEWLSESDLTHWTEGIGGPIVREEVEVHSGVYSCKMPTENGGDFSTFWQDRDFTPGKPHKIMAFYKRPVAANSVLRLYVQTNSDPVYYLKADGTWTTDSTFFTLDTTDAWTEFSLVFNPHPDYTSYRIQLYKDQGPGGASSFYVDDVHVLTDLEYTLAQYQRSEYEVFIRDPDIEPVYIAGIDDLKMDLSGFALVDGKEFTYEVTIDERGLEIDSVWEDGGALAEKPIEEIEATPGSWCWDSAARKLYVHASDGTDPNDFFMEGGFVHRIPNREFAHADSICTLPPWLSASSIPGATQEIKPHYEGNFRLSTGSISFINALSKGEYYFDKRFEKFTWIGAKLSIYLGKETFDSLAKFKKMFTAYISKGSINDGKITFSLADIREDLDRNFVLDKYRLDDYPGATEEEKWDFEGREKPKGYGYIEAAAPTPIMAYDAAEGRSAKFSYHDGRSKSVGKVTVNDIERTQGADYHVDPQRSVIVFDKGTGILENDIVLMSFSAQVNSADEVIENGADAFKHLMNVEAKIPTPELNTDWIYETKYANTKSISAYFYKDTPFNEIIRNIEHTTEAYILQDGEGRIGLRPQQTEVESGAENIWDFQSTGHEHDKDKDSLYWKVKVNFAEDSQLQEWQVKEAADDRIKWKYGVEKELSVNCYFRDPANAQALANSILGLCNKTYIEDELPMILFNVFPGDLIPFSRTRFFDLSGTANEIALRILKIEKNPQTGKTSVRMEKKVG